MLDIPLSPMPKYEHGVSSQPTMAQIARWQTLRMEHEQLTLALASSQQQVRMLQLQLGEKAKLTAMFEERISNLDLLRAANTAVNGNSR